MKRILFMLICAIMSIFCQVIKAQGTQVGPLLKEIEWDQEDPYNLIVKVKENSNYVGCGATAGGQIMKYYGFPLKGTGSKNGIDFSKQTYNWDLILPTYKNGLGTDEQKNEVAKVLHHLGKAMSMVYTPDGSGSSLLQIKNGMTGNFSYKGSFDRVTQDAYTEDEWFELIKKEIDAGRPILCSGVNVRSGAHLFVCDGYDPVTKKVHFNYGWNGRFNEWKKCPATQSDLANSSVYGMFTTSSIMIGVSPTATNIAPPVVLTSAINLSLYTLANRSIAFNAEVMVENRGLNIYSKNLRLALYNMDGTLNKGLSSVASGGLGISSDGSAYIQKKILIKSNVIGTEVADGQYKLRLEGQDASNAWHALQGLVKDVIEEVVVTIKNGEVQFAYPLDPDNEIDLTLASPIEANVANNRGSVEFTIKNNSSMYDYEGDVYVVASSNDALLPETWTKLSLFIPKELQGKFKVDDVLVPSGASVKTCRFSVVYNRVKTSELDKNREISCIPLLPAEYNFRKYTVPSETATLINDFTRDSGSKIPDNYIVYSKLTDQIDETKTKWVANPALSYANTGGNEWRLVTSAIDVTDENCVLEWSMSHMSFPEFYFVAYISTEGQAPANFKGLNPAYRKILPNNSGARLGLSEYVGKKIYVAFEGPEASGLVKLHNIKMLNIRSPKDISVLEVNIPGNSMSGEKFPVKFSVKNLSSNNVKKVKAKYTVGTTTITEEIATDIAFGEIVELTFSEQIIPTGVPGETRTVKVHAEVENEDLGLLTNNEASANNVIVDFYPRVNFIVSKGSKNGCTACSVSFCELDNVDKRMPKGAFGLEGWRSGNRFYHPDFTSIASGSTPSFFINGKFIPQYAPGEVVSATKVFTEKLAPMAEVNTNAVYESADSRKLKIKVSTRFASHAKGNYRVGVFIIENNVIDKGRQISNASKAPAYPKLTKNHIPIGSIGGLRGDAAGAQIISNPQAGVTTTFDFDFEVPLKNANDANDDMNHKKEDIQVYGVLFDPSGNVVNISASQYFIKLPKTEGLTFVAEPGHEPFKHIYEVVPTPGVKDQFQSEELYKSNLPVGGNFKFKIEKSAEWENKKIKLLVNPLAYYNTENKKEEVLLPDEKGVYTIENAQMQYYMGIEILPENGAELNKVGSEVVLAGNWTKADFDKLSISSPSITGLDMTTITIPENLGNITLGNPNTLIYTAADATVPESWKNVIKGGEAAEIKVVDGYAFYNSKSFKAKSISYERFSSAGGWEPINLPFAVKTLPIGVNAERFNRAPSTTAYFAKIESLDANKPYLVNFNNGGNYIFSASDVDIPVTTLGTVTKGNYVFKANFTGISNEELDGLYALNSDGTLFNKLTTADNIPAFRSYIYQLSSSSSTDEINVEHGDLISGVEQQMNSNGLLINCINGTGTIEITSSKTMNITLYSVEGRAVRVLMLNEGVNRITGLANGVYLLGNNKVVVK